MTTQIQESLFPIGVGGVNDDLASIIARSTRGTKRVDAGAHQLASDVIAAFPIGPSPDPRMLDPRMLDPRGQPERQAARMPSAGGFPTPQPDGGLLASILAPLQAFHEHVGLPGAGVLTEAFQRVTPGEQEIQRKVREFQAQGIGPIESRRRAYVESDLPSMRINIGKITPLPPGISIPLPGGRELSEVDIGFKGGIEILADPLNILLGIGLPIKGLGFGGKLLQKGLIPAATGKVVQTVRARKAGPVVTKSVPATDLIQERGVFNKATQSWISPDQARILKSIRRQREKLDRDITRLEAELAPAAAEPAPVAAAAEPLPSVTREDPVLRKHPLDMTSTELADEIERFKDYERNIDERVLGKEGGRRWGLAWRQVDSSNPATRDAAEAEISRIQATLTEAEENALHGIRDPGNTWPQSAEELVDFRNALDINVTDTERFLIQVLANNMPSVKNPGQAFAQIRGNTLAGPHEQIATVKVQRALLALGEQGVPPDAIIQKVMRNLGGVIGDDNAFIMRQWLEPGSLRALQAPPLPTAAAPAAAAAREMFVFDVKPPKRGMRIPKTPDEAAEQLDEVDEYIDELQTRLDEMDNPDTKRGEALQERIEGAENYRDKLSEALDEVEIPARAPVAAAARVPTAEEIRRTLKAQEELEDLIRQRDRFARLQDPATSIDPAPGFKSGQTDLLEARVQALIDAGEATDYFDALEKAIKQEALDAGLPPGKPPGPLAAHAGAGGDDPVGQFTQMINAVPGEDLGRAALRSYDGARGVAAKELQTVVENGDKMLRAAGVGVWNGRRTVMSEADGKVLLQALHGEAEVPAHLRRVYSDLRAHVAKEQADMLAADRTFATSFATHPSYFARIWRQPAATRTAARLGRKPFFKEPRLDATFTEMLDAGFETVSWNPYDIVALRRIAGVEYREGRELISKLKTTGQALKESELADEARKHWRVPEVGPAFQGHPYPATTRNGAPGIKWAVPNKLANQLEGIFGTRPQWQVLDRDVLKGVRWFSNGAKRMKLFGSLFQHVDFMQRVGAVATTPTALLRGAPLRYPSFMVRVANVSFRSKPRAATRARILSETSLYPDFPISHRMIAEQGWQIGGDTSILRRTLTDFMDEAARAAPTANIAKLAYRRVQNFSRFLEDGLFGAVYPESQMFALDEFIIPKLRQLHPSWTPTQVAASAAEEVNKMFSTLAPWQKIIVSPRLREFSESMLFSANETESWMRVATSAMTGENNRLWREYGIGMLLWLGLLGNVINIASTGEALPVEAYLPIVTGSPYSPVPGGIAYNDRFLSPQLPFGGRDGTPVYLDLVGQADTFLRWMLDPPGALTARFNLIPRTVLNQTRGKDFYGRPLEGMQQRTIQAMDDLFAPIGPGNFSDVLREKIPGTQSYIAEREGRLGIVGNIVQATGLNLRAESTPAMLNRVAELSGLLTADGVPVETWSDLEKPQREQLLDEEPLSREMERRRLTAIEREQAGALTREDLEQIDTARFDQELALQSGFYEGIKDGKQILERFGELQAEAAVKRAQYNEDFELWKDGGPLPSDPLKAALVQYYESWDSARDEAGELDYDLAQASLATLEHGWDEKTKAFIDRNTGNTKHPPLFRELRKGRERFGTYWRVHEIVLSKRGHPEWLEQYNAFVGVFGDADPGERWPHLRDVQKQVSEVRQQMRRLSPELDAFLFRFGYTQSLLSPVNQGRETDLAPSQARRRSVLGI